VRWAYKGRGERRDERIPEISISNSAYMVSGLALCIKYREGVQQYGSVMVLIGGADFFGGKLKERELNN
jgi:hypothetical protein